MKQVSLLLSLLLFAVCKAMPGTDKDIITDAVHNAIEDVLHTFKDDTIKDMKEEEKNMERKEFSDAGTTSDSPSPNIDGGGWKLVRHVPGGTKWHPANDNLMGTAVYGTPTGSLSSHAWSIRFDDEKFNQFLFITGDEKKWLIASRYSVTGSWYTNEEREIEKSSISSKPYKAKWYNRKDAIAAEDPWISLIDHDPAIESGNILYGENNYGYLHASRVLPKHHGANVYIRWKKAAQEQEIDNESLIGGITITIPKINFAKWVGPNFMRKVAPSNEKKKGGD